MSFDFATVLKNLSKPATDRWAGFPEFNFVGGHNDPDSLPVDKLIQACSDVLQREGKTLATYSLESGPQGYLPLREFLVEKLKKYSGMQCTADDILLNSGSLQAIDLINEALLTPSDTVIIEASNYGGVISRLHRLGVNIVTVNVDEQGMDTAHLERVLAELKSRMITPAYIYSIPTVHNPTGAIMSMQRREHLIALASEYNICLLYTSDAADD